MAVEPGQASTPADEQAEGEEGVHVGDVPHDGDEQGDGHAQHHAQSPAPDYPRHDGRQAGAEEQALQVPVLVDDVPQSVGVDDEDGEQLPDQAGKDEPPEPGDDRTDNGPLEQTRAQQAADGHEQRHVERVDHPVGPVLRPTRRQAEEVYVAHHHADDGDPLQEIQFTDSSIHVACIHFHYFGYCLRNLRYSSAE